MQEPIKNVIWELGNEIYTTPQQTKEERLERVAWYVDIAKRNIDAIREVDPEAKFALCGMGMPWGYNDDSWRDWTVELCKGLKARGENDIDYMACHPYYNSGGTYSHEVYHMKYTQDVESVFGEDTRCKFIMTEHATWSYPFNYGGNVSLGAALTVAQWFNRLYQYQYENVYAANYHNIISNSLESPTWATFGELGGVPTETIISKMMLVYRKGIGDKIVKATVRNDSQDNDIAFSNKGFSVLTSQKGEKELNLILCNDKADVDYDLSFAFEKNYTLAQETVLTAPNMLSQIRYKGLEDLATPIVTTKNEKEFSTYHMPNKSLVVLKLVEDSEQLEEGETQKLIFKEDFEGYDVEDPVGSGADREIGTINGAWTGKWKSGSYTGFKGNAKAGISTAAIGLNGVSTNKVLTLEGQSQYANRIMATYQKIF